MNPFKVGKFGEQIIVLKAKGFSPLLSSFGKRREQKCSSPWVSDAQLIDSLTQLSTRSAGSEETRLFCFASDTGGSWNHPPSLFLPASGSLSANVSAKEGFKLKPKGCVKHFYLTCYFTWEWTVKFQQSCNINHTGNNQKEKIWFCTFSYQT